MGRAHREGVTDDLAPLADITETVPGRACPAILTWPHRKRNGLVCLSNVLCNETRRRYVRLGLGKDVVEHVARQPSGLGVLLTGMVGGH